MKDEAREPQNELDALLTEEQVGPYTLRRWSLKQLILLTPHLQLLINDLKAQDFDLENLGSLLTDQPMELVALLALRFPDLIAGTLGIDRVEAENMDYALALTLGVRILMLNLEHLKNYFGLLMGGSMGQATN